MVHPHQGTRRAWANSRLGNIQLHLRLHRQLLVLFEFAIKDTRDDITLMDDTLSHLIIRLEAIPCGGDLPLDDMDNCTMIQGEDTLSKEGGEMS
jgi:hypothetical protein